MTTTLGLEAVGATSLDPTVRILLDGQESQHGVDGHGTRNVLTDLIDTDALVPRRWPHRVALYGCGCGAFACSTLTTLVSVEGREVVWSDFRRVTSADFASALPDRADPDPTADPEAFWVPLDLDDRDDVHEMVWVDVLARLRELLAECEPWEVPGARPVFA